MLNIRFTWQTWLKKVRIIAKMETGSGTATAIEEKVMEMVKYDVYIVDAAV